MRYIDFHTHFLPNVDDGADSVEKSYCMLKKMADEGVAVAFATPHCLLSREDEKTFIERRKESLGAIEDFIEEMNPDFEVPDIRTGAEIRVSREMESFDYPEELTLEGTGLMLFELPYSEYLATYGENIYNLSLKAGVTPVIAHMERYINLYDEYDYNNILSIPNVVCQISTDFMEDKKTAKFVAELIRNEFPLIFGSDCHNMSSRPPYMSTAFSKVKKFCAKHKISEYTMDELFEYNKKLI